MDELEPAAPAELRWRLVDGGDLAFAAFGDGVAVHHALTNGTHIISAAAADVLAELGRCGPLSTIEVARRFGTSAPLAGSVLAQLAQIDAVERC